MSRTHNPHDELVSLFHPSVQVTVKSAYKLFASKSTNNLVGPLHFSTDYRAKWKFVLSLKYIRKVKYFILAFLANKLHTKDNLPIKMPLFLYRALSVDLLQNLEIICSLPPKTTYIRSFVKDRYHIH